MWSPPWHLYILLLANLLAFYLTYFLAFDLAFYLAYLLAFYLAYLLAFHLAFYLAYLLAYYLANLLAFYLANILALYLAYLLAFYLTFYLAYLLTFYLAYLLALYVAYLLAWILAVEVRQGTLGGDTRGWGPAGNTGRGYSRLRSGREHREYPRPVFPAGPQPRVSPPSVPCRTSTGRGWSWLRSDRDHCASRVAVEQEEEERRGEEKEKERRGGEEGGGRREEEQATDIKSNNPHLAGGEKHAVHCFRVFKSSFWCPKWSLLVDEQTVNETISGHNYFCHIFPRQCLRASESYQKSEGEPPTAKVMYKQYKQLLAT